MTIIISYEQRSESKFTQCVPKNHIFFFSTDGPTIFPVHKESRTGQMRFPAQSICRISPELPSNRAKVLFVISIPGVYTVLYIYCFLIFLFRRLKYGTCKFRFQVHSCTINNIIQTYYV